LTEYNESYTGSVFKEKVSSFVKNDSGIIAGGILGEINWNWMHIQGLWVDENIRKGGWGTKLLYPKTPLIFVLRQLLSKR